MSPIQQLENFEESEIRLEPRELLPIIEVDLFISYHDNRGVVIGDRTILRQF